MQVDLYLAQKQVMMVLADASVINLVNVKGSFTDGEKIIASDSAETGKLS